MPAALLPAGLPWLNVARPPSAEALAGRLLVLHFFSAGCVHAHQALPVLAGAARRLPGEPVLVVGIHTPRLPGERGVEAARRAVLRHGVTHPVLVDDDRSVWRTLGLRAWPSLALVDPAGRRCGLAEGELDEAPLAAWLQDELARARAEGQELAVSPVPLRPERWPEGPLASPGPLLAAGGRLFLAETGRGEVLEYALPPRGPAALLARHGGFVRPHGLALDEAAGALYVADPGAQRVWRLELSTGERSVAAGTGALGRATLAPGAFAPGAEVALRSPQGLAFDAARRRLHLAMAGAHQVWTLEVDRDRLWVAAGDGREGHLDDDLHDAAFAQPDALALAGEGAEGPTLLVAGGGGAVRAVDLGRGVVTTLVDGDGPVALQRPAALAALPGGGVAVADGPGAAVWLVGPGGEAAQLAAPGLELGEPSGLAWQGGRLLVADAARRQVLAVDLAGGWEVLAGVDGSG
ncbi:MAG: hypothetical protein IPQ24_06175 [Anaeromyxobacter sp.]|nr:hypothetical protein [Anaeromyxobacter sp.]